MNRKQKRARYKQAVSQEWKKHNDGAFGNSKFINRKCPHEAWFNYGSTKKPIKICKLCGHRIKDKKEKKI